MSNRQRHYVTKKAWIVEELRKEILSGSLKPGQRLLELDMAQRFGTSATPVREAMRQLEAEGFVDSEPHRGVRVVDINVDATREYYLICIALEGLMIKLALENYADIPLEKLATKMEEIEAAMKDENWTDLRVLFWEFHSTLYQSAKAPILSKILNWLWVSLPWDRIEALPGRAERMVKEHTVILSAIVANDQEWAVTAIKRQLHNSMTELLDYVRELENSGSAACFFPQTADERQEERESER